MKCSQCGAEIEAGMDSCRNCFAQVCKPGLLQRFFGGLGKLCSGGALTFGQVHLQKMERITIVDQATGEQKVFSSWEEVPAEWKAKFAALGGGNLSDLQAKASKNGGAFTIQNQTYHSLEEMPAEVRAVFEKVVPAEVKAMMARAKG